MTAEVGQTKNLMKRRVLFVCYDGFRTTNARVRCYRFAEQLRANGLDASVFSFKDSLHASHDGEDSHKVGVLERLSLVSRAVARLIREDKKTLFYVQKAGYFALAPLLVSLLKGNKIVLDYDDYEVEQSIISKPLLALLAKRAIFCVAASRYLQGILKRYNKDVHYIPTGVDTEVFKTRPVHANRMAARTKNANKKFVFTWVGIIVDRSALDNVMMILDAFEQISKTQSKPGPRLEIVGAGRHMAEVEKRIHQSKLSNVIYLGRMAPEKIPKYLETVDCGLFILAHDTKYNRSKSPTKLFEYMAMGLPVIATPIGEAGHAITDGKEGFIVKNTQEMVLAIKRLTAKPAYAIAMSEKAEQTVKEHYSLETLGKRLVQILATA